MRSSKGLGLKMKLYIEFAADLNLSVAAPAEQCNIVARAAGWRWRTHFVQESAPPIY